MSAPDLMAIVSRAVFDKQAPGAVVGKVLPFDRYSSENRALKPLGEGGRLFLFTVRPEGEKLWLVAVLERLKFNGGEWIAAKPNRLPATDITDLRAKIRFDSGRGITAQPGSLGMSLQTPRGLTLSDVELLLGAAGPATPEPAAKPGSADERARLLQAITAAPESDAPRLVYADWLQEHDDPRGEFITIQCALAAGLEFPSQRVALKQREGQLLKEYGKEWGAVAESLSADFTFRRGFVDQLSASATKFQAKGEALLRVEPVMRLALETVTANGVAALVAAPWLSVVRRLKLRGQVGNEGMPSLARSTPLATLTGLNLGDTGVGAAGAGALGAGGLTRLVTLSLSGNLIRDKGVAALLAGSTLANCRRLFLARCGVADEGATLLAQASQLSSLTGLCLGNNSISDKGAKALIESPHLQALKRLELDENELSSKVTSALEKRFGRALKLGSGGRGGDDGGDDDEG